MAAKEKIKLRACPNCGSTNIILDRLMGISGMRYKCNTCGYNGDIVMELDIERKFKK